MKKIIKIALGLFLVAFGTMNAMWWLEGPAFAASTIVLSSQTVTAAGRTFTLERYCYLDYYGRCGEVVDEYNIYNDYLRWAGTQRANIESVRWAAAYKASSSNTSTASWSICSLWLGGNDSYNEDIIIGEGQYPEDGIYTAYMYGMCTNGTAGTSRVWFTEPSITSWQNENNGKIGWIGDVSNISSRAYWTSGPISGTPIKIDLTKMLDDDNVGHRIIDNGVIYTRNVNLWRRNQSYNTCSATSGACSYNPDTITIIIRSRYFGKSNVSIGKNADSTESWATTGTVVPVGSAQVRSSGIKKNESRWVIFSHNVYNVTETNRSDDGTSVRWEVRGPNGATSGIQVSTTTQGPTSGITTFSYGREGGLFVGGPRTIEVIDAGEYIARSVSKVTFTKEGTYRLCEQLWIKGIQYTNVCAEMVVEGDVPEADTCEDWVDQSYAMGWTSVLSRVRNGRLNGAYSGWRGSINGNDGLVYARPDDVVEWKNCYYPGAQFQANTEVAKVEKLGFDGHGSHDVLADTANTRYAFARLVNSYNSYKWTNDYKLTTTSPYGFNNLSGTSTKTEIKEDPGNGVTSIVTVRNNLDVARSNNVRGDIDVGKEYNDYIHNNGTPVWSKVVDDGNHAYWPVPYGGDCCCCSGGYTSTPCSCCGPCYEYHKHTNNYTIGYFENGEVNSQSYVRIPYNFVNTAGVKVQNANQSTPELAPPVDAGETINVAETWVKVGARQNSVTEDTYTTRVHDAEVRLVAYVTTHDNIRVGSRVVGGTGKNDEICNFIDEKKQCQTDNKSGTMVLNSNGDLNNNGMSDGTTQYHSFNGQIFSSGNGGGVAYNVFDASAGDYMCFVMAVYPYTSDDDTNWSNSAGDSKWYISEPSCRVIAKRPLVQILGSDLYVSGSVGTSVSEKQQLYGVNGYSYLPTDRSGLVVNGSWVEEGIVALGKVRNLSSGASLGLVAGDSRNSGGLNAVRLCDTRAPLSIANYGSSAIADVICPDADFVGYSGINSTTTNRSALADDWGDGSAASGFYLGGDEGTQIESATGKNIRVVETSGDVVITGGGLGVDTMRVVKATDGTVTISGDIRYYAAGMTSSGQVPKVIIYGKNINIACGVNRIDAMLIAENQVTTCYENPAINSSERARRLTINGAVVANKVDLGRTYGNSVGNGSGTPAEIINYDTTSLIWGRFMAGSSESDTMTVTYQHELAPRY